MGLVIKHNLTLTKNMENTIDRFTASIENEALVRLLSVDNRRGMGIDEHYKREFD